MLKNTQYFGGIMFNKYVKALLIGCTAILVCATSSVNVEASSFMLPGAGAEITLNTSATTIEKAKTEVNKNKNVQLTAGEAAVEVVSDTIAEELVPVQDPLEVEMQETVSENDAEDFSNLVIAKVNDYVNVRNIPSEEGDIIGKLYDKSVGEFVSEQDGWYEIKSGSVQGFVKKEFVVTGEEAVVLAKEVGKRLAKVMTTTLYVRELPTTESSVVGMVPIEDYLTVVEEGVDEGWVKVQIEEGDGYVSTEFVELSTEFVKAESKAEEKARLEKEEAARKKANAAASSKSNSSQSAPAVSGGSGAGSSVY